MGRVIRARRVGPAVVPEAVFSAQLQAAEIRARAEREAESTRERAYTEGYACGAATAAAQLFDVAKLRVDLTLRAEREATQAVLLVAAELLGTTLQAEPEKIASLLRPHLTRMRRAQQIVLRLHPEDHAYLQKHPHLLTQLSEQQQLEGRLELRSDASLSRGGCVIETNLGELDARVETRLNMMAKALGLPEGIVGADPSEPS